MMESWKGLTRGQRNLVKFIGAMVGALSGFCSFAGVAVDRYTAGAVRAAQVDSHFQAVENRVGSVEARVTGIENDRKSTINEWRSEQRDTAARLARIEQKIDDMKGSR